MLVRSVLTSLFLASCLSSIGGHFARAAAPCSDSEYRQFDFWVGEWQVHRKDGSVAGINRIDREFGGCALHEHYLTGRGYSGESFNIYDSSRKVWHQTWVDSSGLLLLLDGHLVGSNMVLEGKSRQPDGSEMKQRITWSPNPDGTVRQLWESTDQKGQWVVSFDGLYTKK
jgi:hypothetical protein